MTAKEYRDIPKKKPNKYRNQPVIVDSIRFASQLEAKRYGELGLLEKAGKLTFRRQVMYELRVNGWDVAKYVADFVVQWSDGPVDVEDCKGYPTPEYKIKKALMFAVHGIRIKEIKV